MRVMAEVPGATADPAVCARIAPWLVKAFMREHALDRWPDDAVGRRAMRFIAEIDRCGQDFRDACSAVDVPGGIPSVDVSVGRADDERLTTKEVAAMLHVTDREVRALAARDTLHGEYDMRGRWLFERREVDRCMSNRRKVN